VTTKPEGVPEGTTSAVDIARDHYSNDNNNNEEQTYGLFCCSFTFTQTRPCIYRTECFVRLQCYVMISYVLYIKMNVCLYVCLYLIQIHISEPIGTKLCTHLPRVLEETVETVGYVWAHNISPFPPFRLILSGAVTGSCTVDACRRHTTPLLLYIRDAACWCDVMHDGLCNENAET